MLAYQQENESDNQQSQEKQEPSDNQQQQYLTVSSSEKNIRRNTVSLGVLFVIGLLCLIFMIKKSTPNSAIAQALDSGQVQIETAIANLSGTKAEMFSQMDEIVEKFEESLNVKQVDVEELTKNPFKYDLSAALGEQSDELKALLREQLLESSKDLQLLSIMADGGRKCCMIDDKILYEGDTIRDLKVVKISERSVELQSDETKVVLRLLE